MRITIFAASAFSAGLLLVAAPGAAQRSSVNAISAKDKQSGAQAHPQLLEQFGGAYAGAQSRYVTQVGQKIAGQSGLSNSQRDFTVTLLNSPVNNAFAIPGGYVYVTRQLMALTNDEAELASVLGHEVGHVAARHGQKRQSAATRNSILGALGQILVGAVAGSGSAVGGLLQQGIGTGTQLLTLRFSRTQEYEADDLGIRYLASAGYDPTAASTMLASLAAQSALEARAAGGGDARSQPEWASTHPDPASRVRRALTKAQATRVNAPGLRNRDAFLAALDGVIYDDDPQQGVVDGRVFRHPVLRLSFTVPQGYAMSNGARAVTIAGNGGQAQFAGGALQGGLDDYVAQVFRAVGGEQSLAVGSVQRTTVNGLPAAYASARASTQSGQVAVTVFAYQFDSNTAYHFVTLTPVNASGTFDSLFGSLRRLSASEASAIRARKIEVVTVARGQTAATLASRMAYDTLKLERFQVLNGLRAGEALTPGQRVKIVTY